MGQPTGETTIRLKSGTYQKYVTQIMRKLSEDSFCVIRVPNKAKYEETIIEHTTNPDTKSPNNYTFQNVINANLNNILNESESKPDEMEHKLSERAKKIHNYYNNLSSSETSAENETIHRVRRIGVTNQFDNGTRVTFPSVEKLIKNYTSMIEQQTKNLLDTKLDKPKTVEECVTPTSDYDGSKNNVSRCCSSDSAVGLLPSDEDISQTSPITTEALTAFHNKVHRSHSLDMQKCRKSAKWLEQQCHVPTRMLLEEQFIEYPYADNDYDFDAKFASRRQSLATTLTDDIDGDGNPRCRYWRTPSVVVSDYSDDVQGLMQLDDIDFYNNGRKDSNFSSSECSLNSSCSNLNYCGSNISILDADYNQVGTLRIDRKGSDCSSCSTLSGDDDFNAINSSLPVIKTRRRDSKVRALIIFRNLNTWLKT